MSKYLNPYNINPDKIDKDIEKIGLTEKQKKFAYAVGFEGMTATEAYLSTYEVTSKNKSSISSNASKINRQEKIQKAIKCFQLYKECNTGKKIEQLLPQIMEMLNANYAEIVDRKTDEILPPYKLPKSLQLCIKNIKRFKDGESGKVSYTYEFFDKIQLITKAQDFIILVKKLKEIEEDENKDENISINFKIEKIKG